MLPSDSLPVCDLSRFVHTGLNNVLRSLESSVHMNKKASVDASLPDPESTNDIDPRDKEQHPHSKGVSHLAFIIVLPTSYPPVLQAHLPQLVGLASSARPDLPAIRLVQLNKTANERVCTALGMHRVSCLGILNGAPNSQALLDFVQAEVAEVEIRWLQEMSTYVPVKVNSIETTQPVAKKQKVDSQVSTPMKHAGN